MLGRTHHADKTERERIARTVHAALSAWRVANGYTALKHWDKMKPADKSSTYESIDHVIANPLSSPADQHAQWLEQKRSAGWTYAKTRDNRRKHHPMMRPYAELPLYERRKDILLNAIVLALISDGET